MRAPALHGRIDRRICVHYRIEPSTARRFLPDHLRPRLYQGSALGGICVFRLGPVRPRLLPIPLGFGAELAWHRIAVEWDVGGNLAHGQYLLRCESDSRPRSLLTPRVVPSSEPAARISVRSSGDGLLVSMKSVDGHGDLEISSVSGAPWPGGSVFPSAKAAQMAFSNGHVLWPMNEGQDQEGFEVSVEGGVAATLSCGDICSAWFDDRSRFPLGSIELDSALMISRSDQSLQTDAVRTSVHSLSPTTGEFLPA